MLLDDKIQIHKVINEVLIEIADGVFFHANDVNSELYNYAWETFNEKLEQKKNEKEEEKANPTGKNTKLETLGTKFTTSRVLESLTLINVGVFLLFSFIFY